MVTTTHYIYDGFQLLGETDETGTLTRRYINEPDDYTHPIGHTDVATGESSYYHYDGQGNTRTVTDENENVTDTFTYDSWGNLLARTGMTNVPFQFGGEHGYYKDEELDTYYVMARVYYPSIIRWLSVDPLGIMSADCSLYSYVKNRAVLLFDPSGLQSISPIIRDRPNLWPLNDEPTIEPPMPRLPTLPVEECDITKYMNMPVKPLPDPPCQPWEWTNDWNPNMCPICSCSETTNAGPSPKEYRNLVKEKMQSIGRGRLFPDGIIIEFSDECVPNFTPGLPYGVTCCHSETRSGKFYICLPRSVTYCVAQELVVHEVEHINQCFTGATGEAGPYYQQCLELWSQNCCELRPVDDMACREYRRYGDSRKEACEAWALVRENNRLGASIDRKQFCLTK